MSIPLLRGYLSDDVKLGAGLNWIRLPIGYWIFETTPDEPFLQRTSWNYFLQVVEWARKYGIRVLVDLHAVPGSQNGKRSYYPEAQTKLTHCVQTSTTQVALAKVYTGLPGSRVSSTLNALFTTFESSQSSCLSPSTRK